MKIIRLLIAYDGTDFHGWQVQPNAPTIQGEIEKRLALMHTRAVTLHGAGRTDAGVHAAGMVAHFHTEKPIQPQSFANGLNSMLPTSIRILEATEEEESFHSRFSATGKTYIYSIHNGAVMMPCDRLYRVHIRAELDFSAMNECLNIITGIHDFASFETSGSRDPSHPKGRGSIRTISDAALSHESTGFFHFSISGDGFLRHMVRNIVGTVLEVGLGRRTIACFRQAVLSRKRSEAGPTAPAHGLMLKKIYY